jgi:anti-sigma regulatory factor (Ser/Thr protein kinase)
MTFASSQDGERDHRARRPTATLLAVAGTVVLVSELATNAVIHAGTAFRVTLTRSDGHVQILVADGRLMPKATSWPSNTHELGGRGLLIIEQLSSNWGAVTNIDGGKSVWATLPV